MAIKSLICRAVVDVAGKSHNCQANTKHRITMGETRLKVRKGRGWDHYCTACAATIIERDIAKLTALQQLKPIAKRVD